MDELMIDTFTIRSLFLRSIANQFTNSTLHFSSNLECDEDNEKLRFVCVLTADSFSCQFLLTVDGSCMFRVRLRRGTYRRVITHTVTLLLINL